MKILAFDTATAACSAALNINGEIIQRLQIAPQQHAELLLPMIQDLLTEAGITLSELNAIAFGCGPGSFMGVRIATGVAQGLAFGADLPVIAVSSLQTLAQTTHQQTEEKNILAAWDARMHAVYWGAYCLGTEGIMIPIQPDALSEPNEVFLPAERTWCATGNGWQIYQPYLSAILPHCQTVILDVFPQACALARIAEVYYQQGKILDPTQAEPTYLRDKVTFTPD